MNGVSSRWSGVVLAVLVSGTAIAVAQQRKSPDLADLRDAVRAAARRGANVGEISRALTAFEQSVRKGNIGGAGRPVPPELLALREAVETASRNGESVEGILKELEAVEKAITGKALARPKPAPPAENPARPNPLEPPPLQLDPLPRDPFLPEFPNFPNLGGPNMGGGLNPNDLKMLEGMLQGLGAPNGNDLKMLQGLLGGGLNNPRDLQMLEGMLKVLGGPGNDPNDLMKNLLGALETYQQLEQLGQELGLPEFANPKPMRVVPIPERARLGIRLERLSPVVIEQLGLEGNGVGIAAVVNGSPAEKAGLKAHDIVVEFAGKAVSDDPADLIRRVNEAKAGARVDLVVLRKGKKVEVKGIDLAGPPTR